MTMKKYMPLLLLLLLMVSCKPVVIISFHTALGLILLGLLILGVIVFVIINYIKLGIYHIKELWNSMFKSKTKK